MKTLFYVTKRNMKMFFKDKGMFFTSLITPIILLVLFVTFLAKIYKQSLPAGLPEGIQYGIVNGQLFSSLFAVSCVTVAFCANMLMVSDKVNGTKKTCISLQLKNLPLQCHIILHLYLPLC